MLHVADVCFMTFHHLGFKLWKCSKMVWVRNNAEEGLQWLLSPVETNDGFHDYFLFLQ